MDVGSFVRSDRRRTSTHELVSKATALEDCEHYTVGLNDADRLLTEGVIDDNARYVFTRGYCAELALALHDRTGWPIVAAGWWRDDGGLAPGTHVGVLMPGRGVVGIEGATGVHSWAGRWRIDGAFEEISVAALLEDLIDIDEAMSDSRAATFVEPVLAVVKRKTRRGSSWAAMLSSLSRRLQGEREA
jgi:hypothetical protein